MLSIHSLLLVFVALVIFHSVITKLPPRKDYYRSLSNPEICMEILHFYPTGPILLYGWFYYRRYRILQYSDIKKIDTKHIFNRVDTPCETSVIFTAFGNDTQRLEIHITLSLARLKKEFSTFSYKFYQGFEPGTFELWDRRGIFGMRVKVFNDAPTYIGDSDDSGGVYPFDKIYTKPINNALCIITENNLAVTLKSKNKFIDSSNFVISLQAWTFRDDKRLGVRHYKAYECYKGDSYPDVPVAFITDDENLKIEIELFYASYSFKDKKYIPSEKYTTFDVSNPLLYSVYNMKNIPKKYAKVFLTKLFYSSERCEDRSNVVIYRTEDKIAYFMIAEKSITILHNVEGITRIYRSLEDPCAKLKK